MVTQLGCYNACMHHMAYDALAKYIVVDVTPLQHSTLQDVMPKQLVSRQAVMSLLQSVSAGQCLSK